MSEIIRSCDYCGCARQKPSASREPGCAELAICPACRARTGY